MYIKGVGLFFGDEFQPWNRKYKAAQAIFEGSFAIRTSIQAGHKPEARRMGLGSSTIRRGCSIFSVAGKKSRDTGRRLNIG
jgi:hypothetical protein